MRPSGRTRSVFELRRLPLTLGRRQRERTKQWAEKYGKTHMVAGSVWISHSVVERTAAAARHHPHANLSTSDDPPRNSAHRTSNASTDEVDPRSTSQANEVSKRPKQLCLQRRDSTSLHGRTEESDGNTKALR